VPYADTAQTATLWATERAIDLWAIFVDDLPPETLAATLEALETARADGCRVELIEGPTAPSPFGLFAALERAGVPDARRLGVLGAAVAVLEAGHRAGAGLIVGLTASGD
jgi:hypothetical protein